MRIKEVWGWTYSDLKHLGEYYSYRARSKCPKTLVMFGTSCSSNACFYVIAATCLPVLTGLHAQLVSTIQPK